MPISLVSSLKIDLISLFSLSQKTGRHRYLFVIIFIDGSKKMKNISLSVYVHTDMSKFYEINMNNFNNNNLHLIDSPD